MISNILPLPNVACITLSPATKPNFGALSSGISISDMGISTFASVVYVVVFCFEKDGKRYELSLSNVSILLSYWLNDGGTSR